MPAITPQAVMQKCHKGCFCVAGSWSHALPFCLLPQAVSSAGSHQNCIHGIQWSDTAAPAHLDSFQLRSSRTGITIEASIEGTAALIQLLLEICQAHGQNLDCKEQGEY